MMCSDDNLYLIRLVLNKDSVLDSSLVKIKDAGND